MIAAIIGLPSAFSQAQVAKTGLQYPEVGWLSQSSYCNPYFGFRFNLPPEIKLEPIHLPVQAHGRHMLLALHLKRLDRVADIMVSAFEDGSEDSAHLAAKSRVQQAHETGLRANGPRDLLVQEHKFYRLSILSDAVAVGDESSYYFAERGYVLHFAVFTTEPGLISAINSAIEHLQFLSQGPSGCSPISAPDSMAAPEIPVLTSQNAQNAQVQDLARVYYGPALPTELVESNLRQSLEKTVPDGRFSHGVFSDPELGVHVRLPEGWEVRAKEDAYRVTELMRDPTADSESSDRRRMLFRSCSRALFVAVDPSQELIPDVHPAFAVAAMPQGCVPDMILPTRSWDYFGAEDLAIVLARSLGVTLMKRARIEGSVGDDLVLKLEGALPYRKEGEMLARRLSLRVSVKASGPWLVFVYSVTSGPSEQRELDSLITIGAPRSIGTGTSGAISSKRDR